MRSMIIFGLMVAALTAICEGRPSDRAHYKREASLPEDALLEPVPPGPESKEEIKDHVADAEENRRGDSTELSREPEDDDIAKNTFLAIIAIFVDPETHTPHLVSEQITPDGARLLL